MATRRHLADLDFGSDSFLDTMCNVVGILIILVVIVGLRMRNEKIDLPANESSSSAPAPMNPTPQAVPVAAVPVAPPAPVEEGPVLPQVDLEIPQHEANKLVGDVRSMLEQLHNVEVEGGKRSLERQQLSLALAYRKQQLAEREQGLSAEQQMQFELARQAQELQAKADQLDQQLINIQDIPSQVVKIDHDSTPISRTILGDETYFQLSGGRIVELPVHIFKPQLQEELERQARRLRPGESYSFRLGPTRGFRAECLIEANFMRDASGRSGIAAVVRSLVLIPESKDLGETVPQALAPISDLRHTLSILNPRKTSLVVWVYPDSFMEFRTLKAEFAKLGFGVASRPMPPGERIGFGPDGSRSHAE